jgi:hypothetical protein
MQQFLGQTSGMKKPEDTAPIDQHVFVLDSNEFENFEKALAAAPRSIDLIDALKQRPSPWRK